MSGKKYYWLKLHKDFFKRHDIRIIEEMPNGKDYILFYLKLLVESIDHEGCLRFSETVPYNEQMLSVITHTNIDIVRSAMKVFIDLKMVEIYSDETIYMNEVTALIGSESASAKRVRKHRETLKALQCNTDVTQTKQKGNIEKDKEIEKELELEKELESFSLFLKEKELSSSFSSEKQKQIYQDYFEIEPFIDIPITSGTIPIYPSLIIYWNEKYSNVWARKELKEIKKWIEEKGTRNAKRTFEFIEKWLNRHQAEDKLTDSELEELKKSKKSFQAHYESLEERRQLFFDKMNDEEWLKQF